jgi:pimeloyl-ACP methyl ester carboxylesterase
MPTRLPALIAALFALAAPVSAQAPPKVDDTPVDTKEVGFTTADGMDIQGTLYKAVKNASDAPCVILLHSFGKDPNKGDWGGLAKTLARKGFNTLRFDFRGHGKSTIISDTNLFWSDPMNVAAFPSLARKKPLPNKLELKDVTTARGGYFPQLANDILAARVDLDKRNDAGEVNTGSVYLIGATDAATLGMLYMIAEWTRPQVLPQAVHLLTLPPNRFQVPPNSDMAGKDIAGTVWLSPVRHPSVDKDVMKRWVQAYTDIRAKNAALYVYGADDKQGKATSTYILDEVLVAKPSDKKLNPMRFTGAFEVKGTKNTGVDLLGNALGTEEEIVKYLETVEKDRKNITKTANRNYTKPPLIVPAAFGIR